MSANFKPSKEGFYVEKKDKGTKSITLDRASSHRDGLSLAIGRGVYDDPGCDVRVDAFDDVDGVGWEAEVCHDPEEFVVINRVEGIG